MTELMAIESAVADLVSQPDLFSISGGAVEAGIMAVDAPLVFAAGSVRRQHTGERVSRDQGRALLIGALKLRGMSDRKIADAVGCDRRSIARVMERLEASGVVPPLKERLAAKVGRLSESVSDALTDLVDAADWDRDTTSALKGLAVALGIATEKGLLLTGQATEIRANVPAGRVERPEDLMAWVSAGAVQTSGPVRTADLESDVSHANAPIIAHPSAPATGPATRARVGQVIEVGPGAGSAGDFAPGREGGGSARAATPGTGDGSSGPQNFEAGGNDE